MPLVGEHQAQDRQLIADLVLAEMNQLAEREANAPQKPTTMQPSQVGRRHADATGATGARTSSAAASEHRNCFPVVAGSCPEGRRPP